MTTLDEITNEKQRVSEALARVDAQRERLTSQLSELEATERVLARYSKGTQPRRIASAKTPTTATKTAAPARPRRRRRTTAGKPAGGRRSSSTLGDQVLAWQPARRSRKSPPLARGPAQTMSASPSLDTRGRAASKSVTASSTPHSRPGRSNAPWSDAGIVSAFCIPRCWTGIHLPPDRRSAMCVCGSCRQTHGREYWGRSQDDPPVARTSGLARLGAMRPRYSTAIF